MGQFAYSFSLTLLHSLWQSALLLLMYFIITSVINRQLPAVRRNILYLLLISQLVVSIITFFVYFSGNEMNYQPMMAEQFAEIFTSQPLFQKVSPWLLTIYMLVVVYKTAGIFYHWQQFKNNCKTNRIKPSVDIRLFTEMKSYELGIKKKVSVWCSNAISSPVTYGFFKPVILLPVALLNHITTEEAETLIVHELTHIRNNDYILNFILITVDTIFFFNPFIKLIAGKIKLEREKGCDVQVLHYKYSSLTYAETLLKTALFKPEKRIFQLGAISRNRHLLNRIVYFTSDSNLNFRKKNYTALTYLLLLLVFCINLFTITEIRREKRKDSYVNTPTLMPGGYNSEMMYSFIADNALKGLTEQALQNVQPAMQAANRFIAEEMPVIQLELQQKLQDVDLEKLTEELKEAEIQRELAEEQMAEAQINLAMPVSYTEPAQEKEMIVKDVNPATGITVTTAYKMVFRDGEWISEVLWSLTESKLTPEIKELIKDSTFQPFNIVQ